MTPNTYEDMIYLQNGGIPIVQAGSNGSTTWNFGIREEDVVTAGDAIPFLYDKYPRLQGKWDGKTTINHHTAVRAVLGTDLPAQQQPRGTCGGRAGSRGLELLQCILIATGQRAKFSTVSHAWLYYRARREYNMLGGGDGVAGGSIPPVMAKYGNLTREECGDTIPAGPRADDLSVMWGAGRIDSNLKIKLDLAASDNIVTERVRVRSAQELADGIASGGIGICSDNQGFTLTRDRDGFCSPRGSWAHYHVRSGVRVTSKGRRGFDYNQSWGQNNPSGPLLEGCPDNCFGVDWDVQDHLCKVGSVDVVFGFQLWNLEQGDIPPWIF